MTSDGINVLACHMASQTEPVAFSYVLYVPADQFYCNLFM
jgi:hypothetical protein